MHPLQAIEEAVKFIETHSVAWPSSAGSGTGIDGACPRRQSGRRSSTLSFTPTTRSGELRDSEVSRWVMLVWAQQPIAVKVDKVTRRFRDPDLGFPRDLAKIP